MEPGSRAIARECIERVFDTGQTAFYEVVAAGPNGSRSSYETFVGPVKVGDHVVAVTLASNDITRRKQAEEALRESEERFELFMDNSPAIAWMKDDQGRYVYFSKSYEKRVGKRIEDCRGKVDSEIWPAEIAERFWKNDQAVLASGEVIELIEESPAPDGTRLLRKDGGVLYADVVSSQVTYRGRPSIVVFFRDVTERKQAEEALRKEHRNLRHLLQSSDRERQLIAYEIHDGLAQQLAGAIMQLQAFEHLKDQKPKEAAKALDAATTMLRQGHFETRRLIAGVRPPILDEAGVAEAVAHLVHELGRDKGPKIEYRTRVDFDRPEPTLENAIYRIAQAALANACQYSKSERIWVSLLQRGDRVRIEVRDWGVGFDTKAIPKNHFGLEGIRQRARLLGGKFSVRSKLGKGTRVTVELPVVPRDEEG